MVKQEILKLIAEIRIAQQGQDTFREYYTDFCSVPRCKKGIVEFLKELNQREDENKVWVFHDIEQNLKLGLVSGKTFRNSDLLRYQLDTCTYNNYKNLVLKKKRKELLMKVGEYLMFINEQLETSPLLDAKERQVYLRRAVARLTTVLGTHLITSVQVDQWHEVEPNEHTNYLVEDLGALTSRFNYEGEQTEYGSIYYDWYGLNKPLTIDSIVTFLDYVDGFLVY